MSKEKFVEKRIIQQGKREAHKRGLSQGTVVCQSLMVDSPVIHHLFKDEVSFQWSTVNYCLAAVWVPSLSKQELQILRTFPYNKFHKNLPQTKAFLKNEDNLVSLILACNPHLKDIKQQLIEYANQFSISLVEYLIRVVVDDLRVDLYDALKGYVLEGKLLEGHILWMLHQVGLLWVDYSLPKEVELYFKNYYEPR